MCTVCGLTDLAWPQDLVSLTELEVLVEKLDATKNGGSGLVLIPCLELLQPLTLSSALSVSLSVCDLFLKCLCPRSGRYCRLHIVRGSAASRGCVPLPCAAEAFPRL